MKAEIKDLHKNYKQKYRSIFVKLMLIMLLMALMVHIFSYVMFKYVYRDTTQLPFIKYSPHYAGLLGNELGSPPDKKKAKEIFSRFNIGIRYEKKETVWATSKDLPSIEEIKQKQRLRQNNPNRTLSKHTIVANPDGSAYLFKWDYSGLQSSSHIQRYILLQLSMATFAFIGAFLFILYVLSPIKQLRKAVNRISEGELDFEVSVPRKDELGELATAFNKMTRRVREMIKNRDQLLVDVSHELRSPITRINLALEFIENSQKKAGIRADLNEIETMITEILESERMKNGHVKLELRHCNIADLIKETTLSFEGRPPGIKLAEGFQDVQLKIDSSRVKIVLHNVLQNALKYSLDDSQPVLITIEQAKNCIKVLIKDDGEGVPETEIPNLFEPFYRIDQSRSKKTGGYGLGLSMSKRIMESHSGSIKAIKNTNRGVTIILSFPK